jgi:Uma2 family endonuclease
MAGGTEAHATIQANLAAALVTRLRGSPCRFIGNDLKILVGENSSRYPDGYIVCSPIDNKRTTVNDPIIVFEVLSPSTASNDLIVKNQEYEKTPTIKRYITLQQDRIGAIVFSRDNGDWRGQVLSQADTLSMPEIGLSIPLSEFYEGLVFDHEG